MLKKLKIICLIMLALLSISVIYGQDTEAPIPDSTLVKISSDILNMFLADNYDVYARIVWDSLILNGIDYSNDYWDAYDYAEEDLFVDDMIYEISQKLHYEGDDEDKFSPWTIVRTDDNISVKCHNKKKEVEFVHKPKSSTSTVLYIINITDIDK